MQHKIPYASTLKIASFNTRSLLKLTMHRQLIDYMRAHNIEVLCLQETKSKHTTQYVVDNYTSMTVSTAPSNQQEHAGVGFVLSPLARNALVRIRNLSIAALLVYRYLLPLVSSISLTPMFRKMPGQKMRGGPNLTNCIHTRRA